MKPTPYFNDLKLYMTRAQQLEDEQHRGKRMNLTIYDALQLNVPIYNNTARRFAGFSKVPEKLWRPEAYEFTPDMWHYLFLVHRVTGSGASFEQDHGFRNSIVCELADVLHGRGVVSDYLRAWYEQKRKMFTSIGNQICPFNKPSRGFPTGGIEYLIFDAPRLAKEYIAALEGIQSPCPIRDAVDWVLDWHTANGMRRYQFVMTAWVLDTAEYFPHLVDPTSHCYYGKNALECFDLLFDRDPKMPKKRFYDEVMGELRREWPRLNPMDLEDSAGCDYIRYIENYVPPHWMEGRMPHELANSSTVQHPRLHPKWVEFCARHKFDPITKEYI